MATISDVFNTTLTKLNTEITNATDAALITQYVNQLKSIGEMMIKHYNIDLATWDSKIAEIDAFLASPASVLAYFDQIKNKAGTGAPSLPNGVNITAASGTFYSTSDSFAVSVGGSTVYGTNVITTNFARWTKIGRKYFVDIDFTVVSIDAAASGTLRITGAPPKSASGAFSIGVAQISGVDLTAGGIPFSIIVGSDINIYQNLDNSSNIPLPISVLAAGDVIRISINYEG